MLRRVAFSGMVNIGRARVVWDKRGFKSMGRKVFQDFVNVLCSKFIDLPSNKDLVNLVILGDGTLNLMITAKKATHNRYPIKPFPYSEEYLSWIELRLEKHRIPRIELVSADLIVEYKTTLDHTRIGLPSARFSLDCTGIILHTDREYRCKATAEKHWGLLSL
jgi:hypothetical protein